MAITNDQVKLIQTQRIELEELILSIKPLSEKEWDAFEKLVAAHKTLTKIDTDSLRQLEFTYPLKEPADVK